MVSLLLDFLFHVYCSMDFFSQIYLYFGWCFAMRTLSNLTNTKNVIRIMFFFSFFYHLRIFSLISISLWMVSLLLDFLFHVYCSMDFFFSDLPLFWLMFCSENLEQLDEYKKGNKDSVFFFVLLPSSQIYFVFYYFYFSFSWIIFLRSTYFCSVNQIFGKHNKGWIFEPFTLRLRQ